MRESDINDIERCAQACAREVAHLVAGGPTWSSSKGGADLVTDRDAEAERAVRGIIRESFPNHRIVGEECGDEGNGEWTWYVDPIDGTVNYAHGLPWYSMSVCAAYAGQIEVGAIAIPTIGALVLARRGRGMRVEGAERRKRADELEAGGLVAMEWNVARPWAGQVPLIEKLATHDVTCRIMGSGTLALAAVALGWVDACLIGSCDYIDHGAGLLACVESGAVCESLGDWTPADGPFIVANKKVAATVAAMYRGTS